MTTPKDKLQQLLEKAPDDSSYEELSHVLASGGGMVRRGLVENIIQFVEPKSRREKNTLFYSCLILVVFMLAPIGVLLWSLLIGGGKMQAEYPGGKILIELPIQNETSAYGRLRYTQNLLPIGNAAIQFGSIEMNITGSPTKGWQRISFEKPFSSDDVAVSVSTSNQPDNDYAIQTRDIDRFGFDVKYAIDEHDRVFKDWLKKNAATIPSNVPPIKGAWEQRITKNLRMTYMAFGPFKDLKIPGTGT